VRYHRVSLTTSALGPIEVLRPIPLETFRDGVATVDYWGDLAPVSEYPAFAGLIPEVSGETWSMAQLGYTAPLVHLLKYEPENCLRIVPKELRSCVLSEHCRMYQKKTCVPGAKVPRCWYPDVPLEAQEAFNQVVLTWAEGRYVIVVTEGEFSLGLAGDKTRR